MNDMNDMNTSRITAIRMNTSTGTGEIRFADRILTDLTVRDIDDLIDRIVDLRHDMVHASAFKEFTTGELRWYVACCNLPNSDDVHEWKRLLIDMWTKGTTVNEMSRSQLIREALTFNERADFAVRRIRASLRDPFSLGWPEYDDMAEDRS